MPIHVSIEQEELRGISRTVAEIHWLLLILILVYLIFGGVANENEPAISSSLFFYAALVMAFRYANFFRTESRWKIAVETRSEEHTSELQSRLHLVCRLLLEKKKKTLTWCCRSLMTACRPTSAQ